MTAACLIRSRTLVNIDVGFSFDVGLYVAHVSESKASAGTRMQIGTRAEALSLPDAIAAACHKFDVWLVRLQQR